MNCKYIFKKGLKKNTKCNKLNCKIHIQPVSTHPQKLSEYESIDQLNTSSQNKSVMFKHLDNLKKLDTSSTEYYKNKLFIDHSISVPWSKLHVFKKSEGVVLKDFLNNIKTEFDAEIYGMETVKNEIMNFICKLITNPHSERNNLALYGPAGVCKTKFIKVLSKVLEIPLKIISLGGIKDSSYFLGHNFTYVESNYGCIIGSIIEKGIMNPIMYFDELDKVSVSENGKDVYSVLSNLTDSTVNSNFTDHYFRGITFDLSKVFYIFTFNDITKIDRILLDRLNIIYIPSPSKIEKCIILKKYCLPDLLKNIGIIQEINFTDECFDILLNYIECDNNITSGIRESIRILEKILLQINKEILLNELLCTEKKSLIIDIIQFNKYLDRIKNTSIGNSSAFLSMYI
jgi:ATP-dependent Lon protease